MLIYYSNAGDVKVGKSRDIHHKVAYLVRELEQDQIKSEHHFVPVKDEGF